MTERPEPLAFKWANMGNQGNIWGGDFGLGLEYEQTTNKGKRILLPLMAEFSKRGWGFKIEYSVYIGSDEEFWSYVQVMIPRRTMSMFDSDQWFFLCAV